MTQLLQTLLLGLLVGGVYALLASGLTLIFGVMNVINIAHGAFLILAAFLTYTIWTGIGLDPLAAIAITTPAMFVFGWLLYNGTVRRIRRAPVAASVLLTFGLALVIEGLVGVDVGGVAAMTFAIGVASAGAGGSIASVLYPFLPGSHYEWISRLLGIIVLGGMGSLPGAIAGALLLGVAETMTTTYIGPEWATAVPYVVIFAVLLTRPQGLMGARLREDVAL